MLKQVDISVISEYRLELMGIATIGILMCHAIGNNVYLPGVLHILFALGQTGNSLFLFLSGFGIFYSLTGLYDSNKTLLRWYKRRYARIFVPYVLWYVVHLIRACCNPEVDWLQFIYSFSLLKYWTHGGGPWFLSVLLPLYAVAPMIKKVLCHNNKTARNVIVITLILTVLGLCHSEIYIINSILKATPHFIAFILGMAAGEYSIHHKKVDVLYFFLYAIFLLLIFFLVDHDFGKFYLSSCIMMLPVFIWSAKYIHCSCKAFRWFGRISLESYLTNGALPPYVRLIPWSAISVNVNYGNYLGYSIVIIVGLLWAWYLHIVSQWILIKLDSNEKNTHCYK